MIKLSEYISNKDDLSRGIGIFTCIHLNLPDSIPEWLTLQIATILDKRYITHSGEKLITPFAESYINNDGKTRLSGLASALTTELRERWQRLYNIFVAEYNPIENYSMTETELPNLTESTTRTTENNTRSRYAFNSVNAIPTEIETPPLDMVKTHAGTRTLTRSGNIGVTTSQQMLESEIALWSNNFNFFREIFKSLDEILTLDIY